jgi:hypothetical protein
MASVQKYLDSKLEDHCRNHLIDEGWSVDDPDFKNELESFLKLMHMSLWRNYEILSTAYYMKIPKKALYRFGYTKDEINKEFKSEFGCDYPY